MAELTPRDIEILRGSINRAVRIDLDEDAKIKELFLLYLVTEPMGECVKTS